MTETPASPAPDLSRLRIQRDETPVSSGGSRRMGWVIAAAVIVIAIAVAGLMRPRTVEVEVATVSTLGGQAAMTGEGISANGYVVARTKASVSAKIAGRLEYLGVNEGTHVR